MSDCGLFSFMLENLLEAGEYNVKLERSGRSKFCMDRSNVCMERSDFDFGAN